VRIGIDNISPGQSTSKQAPGGMRIYLESLLNEFAIQRPNYQFILFTPTWTDSLCETLPANVQIVKLSGVPISRPLRIIYQQTAFIAAIAHQRLDVLFATATVAPLLVKVPVVLAVQFLQFYKMPEAYGWFRTAYLRLMLPLSLKKAVRAIIFTEHSKHDLVRYTRVSPDKVSVIPHGLSKDTWSLAKATDDAPYRQIGLSLTGDRPYIVYVSSTYGYKNHIRLIRAFALFKLQTKLPHVLLLIGSEVSVSFDRLKTVARECNVLKDVVIAGRLDHHQALATYLCADLAVIPTLYETFGYPVLEAMAIGCPVVTSKGGSMAELAGDAAVLVDPLDEKSIAYGIECALNDQSLRQSLIVRGRQRAEEYTWERNAARVLEILEEAGRV